MPPLSARKSLNEQINMDEFDNLTRIKSAMQHLIHFQESVNTNTKRIRIESGRMYDRTNRLSKTLNLMWDRNHVLERKCQRLNLESSKNLLLQVTLTETKKELKECRQLVEYLRNAFRMNYDAMKSAINTNVKSDDLRSDSIHSTKFKSVQVATSTFEILPSDEVTIAVDAITMLNNDENYLNCKLDEVITDPTTNIDVSDKNCVIECISDPQVTISLPTTFSSPTLVCSHPWKYNIDEIFQSTSIRKLVLAMKV